MSRVFVLRNDEARQNAMRYLAAVSIDATLEVVIRPHKKNRSAAQNRLYWKWIAIIGGELGYTKDEMHAVCADRFLEPFHVEHNGKTIQAVHSTSSLKVTEFAEYLRCVELLAAELGIGLPHPDDLYFEAMGR